MAPQTRRYLAITTFSILAAACLAACSSATAGHPTYEAAPSPAAGSLSHAATDANTGSASPSSPHAAPPTVTVTARSPRPRTRSRTRAPAPRGTPVTVTGVANGVRYTGELWATSRISDCAAHAYGTAIIKFFRQHPCHASARRLFTIDYNGRTVVMSSVVVDNAVGGNDDYYRWAAKFETLEKADGTGSVNDLLREGYRIPGVQHSIPSDEAFGVTGQDTVVVVFDAWYLQGATQSDDPHLLALEEQLFPTSLTDL